MGTNIQFNSRKPLRNIKFDCWSFVYQQLECKTRPIKNWYHLERKMFYLIFYVKLNAKFLKVCFEVFSVFRDYQLLTYMHFIILKSQFMPTFLILTKLINTYILHEIQVNKEEVQYYLFLVKKYWNISTLNEDLTYSKGRVLISNWYLKTNERCWVEQNIETLWHEVI